MKPQVLTNTDELKAIVRESSYLAVKDYFEEVTLNNQKRTILSIRETSRITGKAFNTIKRLCKDGLLKTTIDGKITEAALNDYLKIKK